MKKAIIAIFAGTFIIFAIVMARTVAFTSKQLSAAPVYIRSVDETAAAERLAQAVRIPTISHMEPEKFNGSSFYQFHRFLESAFPNVHTNLDIETVSEFSLIYRWMGSDTDLKPILFMGHMDVVPVEPGTEKDWKHPAFEGRIVNGYIWGRGTWDDKLSVVGILEAAEILIKERYQPKRTIYFAFGHDEEVGGRNGAAAMARLFREKGVSFDYVLDEGNPIGMGLIPGVSSPVAMVGVAEKGYISLELTVEGRGGHSSMPPPNTTIGILSSAIHNLERHKFDAEIRDATKQFLEYLGPEMPFHYRMAAANLWLFAPLMERKLASSPSSNAIIRTTTAATMLKAGIKENILPKKASAVVNFRILPGDSVQAVLDHTRRVVDDPRVVIKPLGSFKIEPSAVSGVESYGFKSLQKTIREIFPDALVAPSLVVGATDSRYYEKLSESVFRFSPIKVTRDDLGRIHGTNERVSVKGYGQAVRFYYQLIRNSTM